MDIQLVITTSFHLSWNLTQNPGSSAGFNKLKKNFLQLFRKYYKK